jgi:tRNA (cmo5U34)-methyltransferase
VGQFHWRADSYLELMRAEVPAYERLQDEAAAAAAGPRVRAILELGIGTGETTRRVLAAHPGARLIGIDSSEDMLAAARRSLDPQRVDLRLGRLEDPLPAGPFDLAVSVLAVHHLKGDGKAELFRRVAATLRPGGRFVLGDVVVPERPEDAITPISPDYDFPSTVPDQVRWLGQAGFTASPTWRDGDLAVIAADIVTR